MTRVLCLGWLARLAAMATIFIWTPPAWALPEGGVDLHAHLSMKPALGVLFDGSIDAPLEADSWDDRLSSKLNAAALEASGLSVLVVALFTHPVLGGDMRAQLREQIDEVEAFVRAHPRWAIARDAAEARALLEAGRRVLVLSLEGASGALESEEDLIEFVDGRGIRIVTPLHLVDDRHGGAATLPGSSYLGNPLGLAARALDAQGEIERSARGLTPLGRRLIERLIARGVWIDLTHASDAALTEMVPLARAAGQPLLVTHAMLRRHRPVERATSDELLRAIAASGGIVGLLPSEDGFDSPKGRLCPPGCSAEACAHGANAFAAVWADAARIVGAEAVMLGSDHNGGMRHLRPSCGTRTSLDQPPGLWNIGQSAALLESLARLGAPRAPLQASLERFLSAWGRVRPRPEWSTEALPSRREVMGPSWAAVAMAGAAFGERGFELLFSADMRVRKDCGAPLDAEPMVYLSHFLLEGTTLPRGEEAPYLALSLAPAGIVAASGGDLVEGEILPMSIGRRVSLDQDLAVRIELLRGRLRTTPSIFEVAGVHALYAELGVDLLGYQFWRHLSGRDDLHGVVLAGGSLRLGSVFGAHEGLAIALYGGGGADLTLVPSAPGDDEGRPGEPPPDELGTLSQMFALAGVRVTQQGGRFFQGFEAQILGVRESHAPMQWLRTPHYRGFVGTSF
jgi:microsomal dipeptidase-like Zn-dependent dipeptidase